MTRLNTLVSEKCFFYSVQQLQLRLDNPLTFSSIFFPMKWKWFLRYNNGSNSSYRTNRQIFVFNIRINCVGCVTCAERLEATIFIKEKMSINLTKNDALSANHIAADVHFISNHHYDICVWYTYVLLRNLWPRKV